MDTKERMEASRKLHVAMLSACRSGSEEAMKAIQVAIDVVRDYEYLANNYCNLYDVTRKAISENKFLTKEINDRSNSET